MSIITNSSQRCAPGRSATGCIPEFQNHIMLVLAWSFRGEGPGFELTKVAVQSNPVDSPTRKLIAEEIVANEGISLSKEELDQLDGYNFLPQLIELERRGTKDGWDRGLDDDGDIKNFDELNEYMVWSNLAEPDKQAKVLRGTEFEKASSA
ncbi:hypothetical protein LTR17_024323 [Elasticomyces elasticus]|nr:hypothetical protein LTR17_024323 [Elasticomyces elasticus]